MNSHNSLWSGNLNVTVMHNATTNMEIKGFPEGHMQEVRLAVSRMGDADLRYLLQALIYGYVESGSDVDLMRRQLLG
jgi:hypothetical protein